jgi:ATP-dependent Clp protease ATP-binding subunit ClpA
VRLLLERAEACARERGAAEVGSLDLVLALAREGPGQIGAVFERYGVTAEEVEAAIAEARRESAGRENGGRSAPTGPLAPAPEVASAVARAGRAAESLGRESYEPEDVLLALLSDRAAEATELLRRRFELTRERLVEDLRRLRGQERAIAKAEGTDACHAHEGGAPEAPRGLAEEVRDLEGRFRALCENVNEMRARQGELVRVVRVVWISFVILLLAAIAGTAWFLFPRMP